MNKKIKILLLTVIILLTIVAVTLTIVVFNIKGESSQGEKEEETIKELVVDDNKTEQTTEAGMKEEEPEVEADDYPSIIEMLKEKSTADVKNKDELIKMCNTVLLAGIYSDGTRIEFADYGEDSPTPLDYMIIKEYMDQFSRTGEGNNIYSIEELDKFLSDFYGRKKITNWCDEYNFFTDLGNGTVQYTFGDGDPWVLLENPSIWENDEYYLVSGPCFYGNNGGVENLFYYYTDFLLKKNENATLGATLVYSSTYKEDSHTPKIDKVEASSVLEEGNGKAYGADNLIDGDISTAWVEGVEGDGIGESITIYLKEKTWVHGVNISGGYQANKHLYVVNGEPTKLLMDYDSVSYEQETYFITEMDDVDEPLYDYESVPTLSCPVSPVYTDRITITIMDVMPGTKYNDTCISEITVY